MSEKDIIRQPAFEELDDDMLERVRGGLSLSRTSSGFTICDSKGETLASFANMEEVQIFTRKLISVVGKDFGNGLSWFIPK